ncbi:MAG: hypothetical protein C0623_13145 [Desulfuromonas sp.]|nr:MAG: hypothetical protein C0623_13145 [Desulfuromonas sp.]
MKCLFLLLPILVAQLAWAGEVDVIEVDATRTGVGEYRFDVTLRHSDKGWDHYADRWEILTSDNTMLATRTLYHPHVEEQPFTRSLGNVRIPAEVITVKIRGHDSVHGYGGKEMTVKIPQ